MMEENQYKCRLYPWGGMTVSNTISHHQYSKTLAKEFNIHLGHFKVSRHDIDTSIARRLIEKDAYRKAIELLNRCKEE